MVIQSATSASLSHFGHEPATPPLSGSSDHATCSFTTSPAGLHSSDLACGQHKDGSLGIALFVTDDDVWVWSSRGLVFT